MGRNIRTLETLTGVDVIIDDTPEAVVISCFDPVRKEIAKVSLERLILDGRIHPARIEEIVQKVTREISQKIYEEGEKVLFDLGIHNMSRKAFAPSDGSTPASLRPERVVSLEGSPRCSPACLPAK